MADTSTASNLSRTHKQTGKPRSLSGAIQEIEVPVDQRSPSLVMSSVGDDAGPMMLGCSCMSRSLDASVSTWYIYKLDTLSLSLY